MAVVVIVVVVVVAVEQRRWTVATVIVVGHGPHATTGVHSPHCLELESGVRRAVVGNDRTSPQTKLNRSSFEGQLFAFALRLLDWGQCCENADSECAWLFWRTVRCCLGTSHPPFVLAATGMAVLANGDAFYCRV